MTDREIALMVLADIEAKPKGSIGYDECLSGFERLLVEMRKHPKDSAPHILFRAAASAQLSAGRVGMKIKWEMVDPRAVPVELLELRHVPAFNLAHDHAHGYPVSVPGVRFWREFEKF